MNHLPPVNPCVVSDYEVSYYTLRCKQGHVWRATPADCNANAFGDFDGDGAQCPTCGDWFSDLVDTKMEAV